MTNLELARWYAALVGVLLVVLGLAGFVQNPIVGDLADEPLFITGAAHNVLHIGSGAAALFIAFGLGGSGLLKGLLAFGLAYLLLFLLTLASPSVFGLFEADVNLPDHVLHVALATLSLVIAWLARARPVVQPVSG